MTELVQATFDEGAADFVGSRLDGPCYDENDFCYGSDVNFSGLVDLQDWSELASYWIYGGVCGPD